MATKKGMIELELGPTGRRVAANVARRRESLNLTYAALEKRLTACGHRIPALGLRRIEARARRVDVDDLLALAFSLECTPMFLLAPGVPTEAVTAIPEGELLWEEIRAWVAGQVNLTPADLGMHWERQNADAEIDLRNAETSLEAISQGKRSEKSRSIYEQRRDDAIKRLELSGERMRHFYDDFDDHGFTAWGRFDD